MSRKRRSRSASDRLPLEGGAAARPPRTGVSRPAVSATPDPTAQPDLFDPALQKPAPRTHVSSVEAPLVEVPLRVLTERKPPAGVLFILTDSTTAREWMECGLPLDPRAPVALMEHAALLAALQRMTENGDEPPVVLRVRAALISDWLEPDPDQTALLGAGCHLLSNVL